MPISCYSFLEVIPKSVEFGMRGFAVEYFTGTNTRGVTDETSHEATEEGHDGLEDDFGGAADIGDPDARLALSKRILFVPDGGSGLLKTLRDRFGKKLIHQRCALHKSRNVQRHLAKRYRKEAHRRLITALAQTSYVDAKQMLLELETWLRTKNEWAADSLREAFEELLALHRLKVPALLRKTLMSTNPIERMFSLVRHSERHIKRTRGSAMPQRWLGRVLLYCEKQFKCVKGFAGIAPVLASIEAEQAERQIPSTTKPA